MVEQKQINVQQTVEFINKFWDSSIQPTMLDYIKIPNMSKAFDAQWNENGLLLDAAKLLVGWVEAQKVPGLTIQLLKDEDKSPLIYINVPGTDANSQTVCFYGHFDKQPPFEGWFEGLGPYTPVIKDGKIYGRGGADDGYSIFGAVTAIKICLDQGLPVPRCVCLIEGDEESGSTHFPLYLNKILNQLGDIAVVFCLDSGTMSYDTFYVTNSLRGAIMGKLNVKVLNEGVHSGDASGIIPSSFRIARNLLDRIEDSRTGEIILPELHVDIPPNRYRELYQMAEQLGYSVVDRFPKVQGLKLVSDNAFQSFLNNGWKPYLEVTGADGFPATKVAGNVLRPETSLKLSIRLPPTKNAQEAIDVVKKTIESNPPHNATVSLTDFIGMGGWNAPQNQEYLDNSVQKASQTFYKKPALGLAMGGSIPLMGLLQSIFPKSQFVITGILGPASNAHGPNEFLHIEFTKNLIACIAQILSETTPHLIPKK